MKTLHEVERDYILQVCADKKLSNLQVAKLLDIGKSTLYRKLRKYAEEAESRGK